MNLSWLDDFQALAATGNFSRAAEDRHMTQPAFSRRIRALEEWLGAELFDRSTQPARLTEAGEWFRHVAQGLLAQVARLPGEAQTIAEAGASTLKFAATHALSFTFMPGWLRGLESRLSVGPVQLVSDVMPRCEALLQASKVHFVLSHAHPGTPGVLELAEYPSLTVGHDTLVPVSAPDAQGRALHTLASGKAPLLAYSVESGLGHMLQQVMGERIAALHLPVVFTAHLASVLKTMALDGRGMAWLPDTLVAGELAQGRLLRAASADWDLLLDIRLFRDLRTLGRAPEAFWAAVP
jgi:LysR family transcriptional regulator, hypochlorite-specific transcription factor HypT